MALASWQDDEGVAHKLKTPNSHCVPAGHVRLLSPQHWAKAQKDTKPLQGAGETTLDTHCALFWGQRKHELTMPLGKKDNVATFRLAPGFNKFTAFCADCGMDPATKTDNPVICNETDEDDIDVEIKCQQAINDNACCHHPKCACTTVSKSKDSEGEDEEPAVWCTPAGEKFESNGDSEGGPNMSHEQEDK